MPDKQPIPSEEDWVAKADAKSRSYAEYWEWHVDKPRVERHAAEVVVNYLSHHEENWDGTLSNNPKDPPDVTLTKLDGQRIGLEVTELVDEEMAAFHRKRKKDGESPAYDCAFWDRLTLSGKLLELINNKKAKIAPCTGYTQLLIVIVTDEPIITAELACEAAALCKPTLESHIRVFFALSYTPSADKNIYPDGCPVFEIRSA